MARPHRIILHKDPSGRWRYKVKAGNHQVVDRSEQGFRLKSYAKRRALKKWPGAVIEVEA